jgi:catechol 2,3-dioxygenase-like lactoylglutathione lyase family enzyme
MPEFPSLSHIAITVSDLAVSRPWYRKFFGMEPAIDEDTGPYHHVVWALPNGTFFGLHQFPDPAEGRFDERRVGLDHVSFLVASREEIDAWLRRLDDEGIPHGTVNEIPFGTHLAVRDPDNIQLELFAPAG